MQNNRIKKIKSKWSLTSRFLYLVYSFLLINALLYTLSDISIRIYFNREFWNMIAIGVNAVLLVIKINIKNRYIYIN